VKSILLVVALLLSWSCRQSTDEASRSVIDGNWETDCLRNADGSSQKLRYAFLITNAVTRTQSQFSDPACAVPRGTVVHTGIFELAVRTEVSLYDIDQFYRKVYATPADAAGAAAWNAQAFCGLTRWVARGDEEVTPMNDPNCGVFGTSLIEYRDLVQVEPNTTLTFGSSLRHQVPRPDAVDASNPLLVFHFVAP
jgi:hypothetical protein